MDQKPVITVHQAAKLLRRDPRTVSGVAIGLGIELMPVASGLTISRADFERIRDRLSTAKNEPSLTSSS